MSPTSSSTVSSSQSSNKELQGFNPDNEDLDSVEKFFDAFDPHRFELWQVTVPKVKGLGLI